MSRLFLALMGVLLVAQHARSANWTITDTINPSDYDNAFDYFDQQDPTGGFVLYQSQFDAKANNLTGIANGKYYMRVDTTEQQSEGRRSIRLSSKKSYNDGVYILNVTHVPIGCAVWPAFWTVTENLDSYPEGGEIDILENANDLYSGALSTLHTKSSCIVPTDSSMESGVRLATNCSVYTPNNAACSVVNNGTSTPSWGSAFNKQGGGVFAMERSFGSTGHGVRIWYWTNDGVPADVKGGSSTVDPDSWGTPGSSFDVADNCHSQFGAHKYNQTSCSTQYPNCGSQVGLNGSSFENAYWSIGSLRVFATGGGSDNAANSPNTTPEPESNVSGTTPALHVHYAVALFVALAGATALVW